MKMNNVLKVVSGITSIAQKVSNNTSTVCSQLVEDKFIKGNYVTREEYNILQELVIKLQKELVDIKSYMKQ